MKAILSCFISDKTFLSYLYRKILDKTLDNYLKILDINLDNYLKNLDKTLDNYLKIVGKNLDNSRLTENIDHVTLIVICDAENCSTLRLYPELYRKFGLSH